MKVSIKGGIAEYKFWVKIQKLKISLKFYHNGCIIVLLV